MMNSVKDIIKINTIEAVELLLPVKCVICGKSTSYSQHESLDRCYRRITGRDRMHVCNKCLVNLVSEDSKERWNFCLSNPVPNDSYPELPLYLAFPYDGIMRKIITNLKFRDKRECGYLAGMLLGKMLKDDGVNADMIIPMPLHPRRLEERGYNQAEIIAHSVAEMNEIPMITGVLLRERYTERQSEIKDVNERISNVSHAFTVAENWDITGSTIILIDDVVTTGFTMHEAASVLLNNGASKVLCCAVAGNRLLKNADRF
ncbi:MAG: ComF family protein [Clostridia bacterium]|nr:ComF family protein [Clostridia bacterium]